MKKYVFKKYTKKSGTLTPFSLKFDIPFKTKSEIGTFGTNHYKNSTIISLLKSQQSNSLSGQYPCL